MKEGPSESPAPKQAEEAALEVIERGHYAEARAILFDAALIAHRRATAREVPEEFRPVRAPVSVDHSLPPLQLGVQGGVHVFYRSGRFFGSGVGL